MQQFQWCRKSLLLSENSFISENSLFRPAISFLSENNHFRPAISGTEFYRVYGEPRRHKKTQDDNNASARRAIGTDNMLRLLDELLRIGYRYHSGSSSRRSCMLLQDVLSAAKTLNISFSFPQEQRYSFRSVCNEMVCATLSELATLDSDFSGFVIEEDPESRDELHRASDNREQYNALLCRSLLGSYQLGHDEQLAATVSTMVEKHFHHDKIAFGMEWIGGSAAAEMMESIDCNSDDISEDALEEHLLSCQGKVTKEIAQQAEQRCMIEIATGFQSFFREWWKPLPQDLARPPLLGDEHKFMSACFALLQQHFWSRAKNSIPEYISLLLQRQRHYWSRGKISVAASLLLQQLIEEIGSGVAPQPFYLTHPGVSGPFLCRAVFGPYGTSMVSKMSLCTEEQYAHFGNVDDSDSDPDYMEESESDDE